MSLSPVYKAKGACHKAPHNASGEGFLATLAKNATMTIRTCLS